MNIIRFVAEPQAWRAHNNSIIETETNETIMFALVANLWQQNQHRISHKNERAAILCTGQ